MKWVFLLLKWTFGLMSLYSTINEPSSSMPCKSTASSVVNLVHTSRGFSLGGAEEVLGDLGVRVAMKQMPKKVMSGCIMSWKKLIRRTGRSVSDHTLSCSMLWYYALFVHQVVHTQSHCYTRVASWSFIVLARQVSRYNDRILQVVLKP